jgi:hypothetical protein
VETIYKINKKIGSDIEQGLEVLDMGVDAIEIAAINQNSDYFNFNMKM